MIGCHTIVVVAIVIILDVVGGVVNVWMLVVKINISDASVKV
jgi:hypothetical protein